ncbi:Glutamate receptor [Rhynchospora pubera]|uniref:Glutamate receptor n=1 Tax=Rhynchospora pubera TaxID=906938 RepID=A0AAV8F8D5_9POAL|nr:Glutamate receptor [Rhynchospora pubera]
MSYPESALVRCLADFVKSYKWRRVIMAYEDDGYGTISGTAQLLAYALQQVGTLLDYTAVFPSMVSLSDPTSIIRSELDRMRQHLSTVYIVLRSSENLTLSLFQEASTYGMMNKGSVWICGPDVTTLLDSILNASFISNHMEGIIGVEPYIKESEPEYNRFSSEFQQSFRSEYEKRGETSFNPGIYAVRAFDVLYAITVAANRSSMNGSSLMDNLEVSNFTGLSGLVMPGINDGMTEESAFSTFRIVNVVGKSYKEIGYWSGEFGFYKDDLQSALQQLPVVLWPGETNVSPAGLRKLKVVVPVNPASYGFVEVEFNNETNNASSFSGFCIDVFISALGRLNSSILFEFVPFTIGRNLTYDDLLYQVYTKKFDVAIGDITITSSRSENVSFTEPYIGSGLTMVVPLKERGVDFLLVIRPFHWKLWVTYLSMLISTFAIIWGLEKFDSCNSADNQDPWYKQLEATFWVVGNTLFQNTGQGICNKKNSTDKKELSFYSKVITIAWLLVILIVSNCYIANLSSILVTEKLKPNVNKSIVGCQNVSFVVSYVERVLKFKPENIVPIKVPEEVALAFGNKTITMAIMELPYARIFLSKHKNYALHGETQMLGGLGFALEKNDPLRAELSRAILELQEDGTIQNLESQWFSSLLSESDSTANSIDDRQSLSLNAVSILFVLYGAVTNGEGRQGSSDSQGQQVSLSNQSGERQQEPLGHQNGERRQVSLNAQNNEGQQGPYGPHEDGGGQQVFLVPEDGGGLQVPSGTQDGGGHEQVPLGLHRRTRSTSTGSQTE